MPIEIDVPGDIEPLVEVILRAIREGRRKRAVKDLENIIQALNSGAPDEIPDTLELLEELRER